MLLIIVLLLTQQLAKSENCQFYETQKISQPKEMFQWTLILNQKVIQTLNAAWRFAIFLDFPIPTSRCLKTKNTTKGKSLKEF